jgi:hypothetical protein
MEEDAALLIPVGIKLHPSLLVQHLAEMFQQIKAFAREIGFHRWSPQLA